jgi:cellulose synthase operon protein B
MNKKVITSALLVLVLLIGLMMSMVASASAQAPAPTPVPAVTEQVVVQPADPNVVTFDTLGQSDIQLIGPFASKTITFGLPADWKISAGAELNLAMVVSFAATGQIQSNSSTPVVNPSIVNGGTLTVYFNNILLGVLQLDQIGESQTRLPIPDNALTPIFPNGRMAITLILDSSYACTFREQTIVTIHASSQLMLPHDLIALSTDLASFPRPLYQGSFVPDSALVVVPDQPSATDLQEAMIVAAGLGNLSGGNVVAPGVGKLSGGNLVLDMTTVSQLTSDQKSANHLIFVGKAGSLPILTSLELPMPSNAGQFQVANGGQDDGMVEMIDSPWSKNHVILVASGNTDPGALKAAQAVSTGTLLASNQFPNVSIIHNILSAPVSAPQPVDQTLSGMGYSRTVFQNFGAEVVGYQFYIPPGWTVDTDARFNLVFGNSSLLNYDRSGIVVSINNIPIGSVRFSDATAAQTTNTVGISIPSSAVLPGNNLLTVMSTLIPLDSCTSPSLQGLWIQVWPESNLHLPLVQATVNPVSTLDLSSYPAPFNYNSTLGNTAFVLSHNDLASWRAALIIAGYLGQRANATMSALSVYYSDQVSDADRQQNNLLVIGVPSQSPIIKEMNSSLPVPFSNGDSLPTINSSRVTYSVSSASPLGYIEMMPSPWNPANIVLAVLGNQAQGVSWATSALIDPTLRSNLAGNFDVINNRQILTSDTRVSSIISATSIPPMQSGVQALPPSTGTTAASSSSRPAWILPSIAATVFLIVVILVFVVIGGWLRSRRMRRTPKND